MSELSALRGKEILAESMGEAELEALGLAPPRVEFKVYGAAPEEGEAPLLAHVHLGAFDHVRGIPARAADRDTVYRLSTNAAELLPAHLEAYRDRFVEAPAEQEEPEAEAELEPGP